MSKSIPSGVATPDISPAHAVLLILAVCVAVTVVAWAVFVATLVVAGTVGVLTLLVCLAAMWRGLA